MKMEPPMFRQIVDCMDQLLKVYEFNAMASECTPFNGEIIRSAINSKIDQLSSLRQLFINLYNDANNSRIVGEEKEVKKVSLICDRCGEPFLHNVLFDKNGVSVNTIKSPLMCSKCMVYVKKNGG